WNGVLHPRPLVKRWPLLIRAPRRRNRSVSPHDRELVVRTDAGNDVRHRNVVLWLRDVVEPRIVHDRRRVSHPVHPGGAAHAVGGISGAADLIVTQSKRVSDLVRYDE